MGPKKVYLLPFSRMECKNKIFDTPMFKSLRDFLFLNNIKIETLDYFDFKHGAMGGTLIVFNHPGQSLLKKFVKRIRGFIGGGAWAEEKYFTDYEKYFSPFRRKILFQWESPVITPNPYRDIEKLKQIYNKMLFAIKMKRFDYFHYPQTQKVILEECFENNDRGFITLISANKRPGSSYENELYTERLRAIEYFSKHGLDLYGKDWKHQTNFSAPFRQYIDMAFCGSPSDKYKTLSKYKFAICYENSAYPGWITEKIFDCFLAGTIPIYLGAPDISEYVPKNCFIDFNDFKDYVTLNNYLRNLSKEDIKVYKEAIRVFLSSDQYAKFQQETFFKNFLSMIDEDHKLI